MDSSSKSCDLNFAYAIHKCSTTLSPKRSKKFKYSDGDDLAALLRSRMDLGPGEREMLAQLVTGELQRPPGKQQIGIGSSKIKPSLDVYFEIRKKGGLEKVAFIDAKTHYEQRHGKVSNSQLRAWIAATKDRQSKTPK